MDDFYQPISSNLKKMSFLFVVCNCMVINVGFFRDYLSFALFAIGFINIDNVYNLKLLTLNSQLLYEFGYKSNS